MHQIKAQTIIASILMIYVMRMFVTRVNVPRKHSLECTLPFGYPLNSMKKGFWKRQMWESDHPLSASGRQ